MSFWIQVGNPTLVDNPSALQLEDGIVEDLSEAIEAVFPMETENAILVWNHIHIPLSYKYDLSVIIDDILFMLSVLLESKAGQQDIYFGSNTFRAKWSLVWVDGDLFISAKWDSLVGDLEIVSTACSKMEITIDRFLYEWKALLRRLKTAVDTSGLSMQDTESYESLIRVESAIDHFGRLPHESI